MFGRKKLFSKGGAPPPDETEAILGRHLDGDFIVFPMADSSATGDQVTEIAARFGVIYPPEFIAHACGLFPGIYVEVKEALWPRPKAYDVGPFWSFLYAMHTFSPVPSSERWMRLDHAAERFQRETGLKAAPILRVVGDADVYCVTPTGDFTRFRHETNELEPVQGSFWQLFEKEISALGERKHKKLSGA